MNEECVEEKLPDPADHQDVQTTMEIKIEGKTPPLLSGEPPKTTQNIVSHMMDIAEPLASLKKALEHRLQCSLKDHEIYLQNSTLLSEDKSLVEQGINAKGILQFSVQVISAQGVKPRLNIVDVIKPITVEVAIELRAAPEVEDATGCKWVVCNSYKEEQEKLGIPFGQFAASLNNYSDLCDPVTVTPYRSCVVDVMNLIVFPLAMLRAS